jgi:hypothetical protein
MWDTACAAFGGKFCLFKEAWDAGEHPTVLGLVLCSVGVLGFLAFCAWAWRNK